MEYVGRKNIKKLCNFYVNDLHLSVMLLPYLSKQIDEDVEITTIFEKLQKKDMEEILEKLNIKNKDKILDITWLNSDNDTNEEIEETIKKNISKKNNNIIIISGNQKYISHNNKHIEKILESRDLNTNIKIIDCYNVEETGTDMKNIVNKYDGILNTSGETKIV